MPTDTDLLTDKQRQPQRLSVLFGGDKHVQVEATWGIYQRMIAASGEPDRTHGRQLMTVLIDPISRSVPAALSEITILGRRVKKRAEDVFAYFDRRAPATDPPRRSAVASSTCGVPPGASETSPT